MFHPGSCSLYRFGLTPTSQWLWNLARSTPSWSCAVGARLRGSGSWRAPGRTSGWTWVERGYEALKVVNPVGPNLRSFEYITSACRSFDANLRPLLGPHLVYCFGSTKRLPVVPPTAAGIRMVCMSWNWGWLRLTAYWVECGRETLCQ